MAEKNKVQRGPDTPALDKKQVKEFQQMVADIGSRKTEGFIFIVAPKRGAKKEANMMPVRGLVFSHRMDPDVMVMNMVQTLYQNPLHQIVLLMKLTEHFQAQMQGKED